MDDDLQHKPADITKLYNKILKCDQDIIYANFESKKQSFLKNIGSYLNGKLAEVIIQKPKDIYLFPFKIMKKEIADEIIKYKGRYPYIDGLIFQTTSSIGQIDIPHYYRAKGSGGHNLLRSVKIVVNFCTSFPLLLCGYRFIWGY